MNLKLVRPSSDAPEALALYERLRSMSEDDDQDVLREVVQGLFSIVAKLEAGHDADD